jgi:nicotinamidase-related amidase
MRLTKENTIGLVIDMQEKLLPHMEKSEKLRNNCITLIKGFKALNLPTLVTQQYTKGLGSTIKEVSQEIDDFSFFEKITFSCYRESGFVKALKDSGKHNVVIMGIETHVCVLQTALDLLYHNFNPVVVIDATGTRKTEDKNVAISRMRDAGIITTSYESVLFELCVQAGTDEFKTISKLVK